MSLGTKLQGRVGIHNSWHTLEERYEIPERSVMDVPRPLVQDDAVLRMELYRLGVCVNDDHLGEGPVQVGEVLGIEQIRKEEQKVWKYARSLQPEGHS